MNSRAPSPSLQSAELKPRPPHQRRTHKHTHTQTPRMVPGDFGGALIDQNQLPFHEAPTCAWPTCPTNYTSQAHVLEANMPCNSATSSPAAERNRPMHQSKTRPGTRIAPPPKPGPHLPLHQSRASPFATTCFNHALCPTPSFGYKRCTSCLLVRSICDLKQLHVHV